MFSLSRLGKTSWATATGSKSTPRPMCESTERTSMTRPGNLWLLTGLSSKICYFKSQDACIFFSKSPLDYPENYYHYPQRDELAALVELLTDKETFARTVSQEEMEEEDSMQGLEDIIRDTGPVDSNLTSANASKYNSEVGLSNDLKDLDGDDEDHADNGWINIDVI